MRTMEASFRALPVMQNLPPLRQILNLKISIVPSHPWGGMNYNRILNFG